MEPRLWELAAATHSLCVARGTSLVIYGLARVNERGPSAGVAYCTPPRLGRSRVEHFLFNLLVHNAPCFLHALFIREHHSIICFTSKRLVSRGNETFRVCPRVFSTRSRTLHVLDCGLDGAFCFTKHEMHFVSATGVLSFFIGNYTQYL